MRCHIRLVLDDELHLIQWSTDLYADDGRKLRTVVRGGAAPSTSSAEGLDEAMQDLASIFRDPPKWF